MAESVGKKTGKCPICGKPVESQYRPFCSTRCQQIDLGKWLGENYRIAADTSPNSADGSLPDDDET
jgi:hypothetical protein